LVLKNKLYNQPSGPLREESNPPRETHSINTEGQQRRSLSFAANQYHTRARLRSAETL
jgi:tetraacyldisaccharide-1-P 4'-kinase